MIDHRWQLWLVGWAAAAAIETALYLLQRRTRDATAVDAGWALSLATIAVLCAVLGPGCRNERILVAIVAGWENLRIASVVGRRIGHGEDSRYRDLRARWRERGREQRSFFVFYEAQALLAAILALPFVLAVFAERITAVAWAGAAVWAVGAVFQVVADEQLRRFKAVPENTGRTMRYGLWRYSRHPNYFFQCVLWFGYALVACAAPWGWLGFAAPVLLTYLVVFVTGIPPSEEASLRSRGDDYRRYQRETSAFVPWFPRS